VQATTTVLIGGSEADEADVQLLDSQGKLVLKEKHQLENGQTVLDMREVPNGIYILRLNLNNGEVHLRNIVKQ
jgi:hypothetical protein